jgi:hypothetical protein
MFAFSYKIAKSTKGTGPNSHGTASAYAAIVRDRRREHAREEIARLYFASVLNKY